MESCNWVSDNNWPYPPGSRKGVPLERSQTHSSSLGTTFTPGRSTRSRTLTLRWQVSSSISEPCTPIWELLSREQPQSPWKWLAHTSNALPGPSTHFRTGTALIWKYLKLPRCKSDKTSTAPAILYQRRYTEISSPDLSPELLALMASVCLAQAQECILEKSILDHRKSSIIAKVGIQVSLYYYAALHKLETSNLRLVQLVFLNRKLISLQRMILFWDRQGMPLFPILWLGVVVFGMASLRLC